MARKDKNLGTSIARRDFLQGAVIAAFVALFVLPPSAVSAHAPQIIPMTCKEFGRSEAGAPVVVREYLNRTNSDLVKVCGSGDTAAYYEIGEVSKRGDMCHAVGHFLELSHAEPSPRLQRTKEPPRAYMLVTKSACPPPVAGRYAYIQDVGEDEVSMLSRIWRDAISSIKSFDGIADVSGDAAPLLRSKITRGRSADLSIGAITKEERFFFVPQQYQLIVRDSDDHQLSYYVTVTRRWLASNYAISEINVGVP